MKGGAVLFDNLFCFQYVVSMTAHRVAYNAIRATMVAKCFVIVLTKEVG